MQEEFCPPAAAEAAGKAIFFLQSKKSDSTVRKFQVSQKKSLPPARVAGAGSERKWEGGAVRVAERGAVDGAGAERGASRLNALGRHLLLELFDCAPDAIDSLEAVKGVLVEAARLAQATIVDIVFHEFNPFGISGVVVIAESHLAIHTWPEYRYAAVDIFSCGEMLKPEVAANYLVEQFAAERTSVVEMQRGMFLQPGGSLTPKTVAAARA